ncbi:MAG: hypothetical protein AAFY76_01955 [Cyanobacteria bacterium J06649_11]
MKLVNVETGEKIKGRIRRLTKAQLKKLKGSKHFQFDWSLEGANEVYAIVKISNDELLGLISLTDVAEELRIHINLIESAIKHQGKKKEIDGIPGCLIGFACEMSFKKGYDGFVSLTPKTRLVEYYHKKFGFLQTGVNMAVFLEISQSIIKTYLKDE